MARSPDPPGSPPPHYRPPGAPAQPAPNPLPGRMLGSPTPPPRDTGLGPGAVTTIAIITLLIGGIIGFFVGRASESDGTTTATPTTTEPTTTAPTTNPPGDTIPQNQPADQEAPPSTDLAPTTFGTLEDPIPAGQGYVLGLYEIEVRSVELDAGDTLLAHNPSNPPSPEASQHVLVEIVVRYEDSNGVGNPGAVPFFVSDGSGEWQDFEATCGSVPNALVGAGILEQGDEAVGNACFTVPSDAVDDELLLGTEGFAGPVYFELPTG
ncbi:MAG: hypothetical protein U5K30_03045 [Acidimicrobiales bacterium]|nr:hypothetical protein [Acidimicrobiales bacterium]